MEKARELRAYYRRMKLNASGLRQADAGEDWFAPEHYSDLYRGRAAAL